MSDIKTWRYYLPNIRGEGWGVILLDSTGFFAAVSDYGNYAHGWWDHGCGDFREFFLGVEKEISYFLSKFSRQTRFDSEASANLIRYYISRFRHDRLITREEARYEWVLAEKLACDGDQTEWYNASNLDTDIDLVYDYPPDAKAFVHQLLPRLSAVIAEELKQEKERTTKGKAQFIWRKRGVGHYQKQICPDCRHEFQAGQIIQLYMPYCGACGKVILDAAHTFCGWCGAGLEYTTPPNEERNGTSTEMVR